MQLTCAIESNFCCTSIHVLLRDAKSRLPSSEAIEDSSESQSNFGATAASAKALCGPQLCSLTCKKRTRCFVACLKTLAERECQTAQVKGPGTIQACKCTLLRSPRAEPRSIPSRQSQAWMQILKRRLRLLKSPQARWNSVQRLPIFHDNSVDKSGNFDQQIRLSP